MKNCTPVRISNDPRRKIRSLRLWWLTSLLLLPTIVGAQPPSDDWRTVETAHFRVHFPAPAEAWTLHVVARLEAIRETVGKVVGHVSEDVVDVVVTDPSARANGFAYPILGWPRLVLFTTPPDADDVIAHYRDWGTLLAIHEQAHLAHLTRPSRNRLRRLTEAMIPVSALARQTPRWLAEGYATLIEGRLTGVGRPYGDIRAAMLRRWARRGELPSYAALSGDGRWRGGSMAYLAGSAFLEWLEADAPQDALPQLWRRMSATRPRTFEQAFVGVFGDAPHTLYNRFRAELTHAALESEARSIERIRHGTLWQDLSWSTGVPTVSSDGAWLAVVARSRDLPPRLVVWSTDDDERGEARRTEQQNQLLARDPLDIAAVRRGPLPRKPAFVLPTRDGAAPYSPRFLPGGDLLFVRYEPDGQGALHPDLFRWMPTTGAVTRLTRGADLVDPDPAPDGTWAVAVRQRWGATQLVRVEVGSGSRPATVTPLGPARVDVVVDHPRIAPDGRRLAWVEHRDGRWQLRVGALDALDRARSLPTPEGATIAHPAWSPDGRSVYAAIGERGTIDLRAFDLATGFVGTVAHDGGALFAPTPTPDGSTLFYLGLEPDGLDLFRIAIGEQTTAPETVASARRLARAKAIVERGAEPPAPAVLEEKPVPSPRPYGLGRIEWLPLMGGRVAPSGRVLEVGARAGDLLGRMEILALGSIGDGGPRGGTLAATLRTLPIALGLRLAAAELEPSKQPRSVPGLSTSLDLRFHGVEAQAGWARRWRTVAIDLDAGFWWGELAPRAGDRATQRSGWLDVRGRYGRRRGEGRFDIGIAGHAAIGRTGKDAWQRHGITTDVGAGWGAFDMRAHWRTARTDSADRTFDRLTLGGSNDSILPRALESSRITAPALATGTLVGDRYEGQRLALGWRQLEVFVARHRLTFETSGEDWLALRGVELTVARSPWPLLRLPAIELTLGIAEILDPPFEGDVEGWLRLRFRP